MNFEKLFDSQQANLEDFWGRRDNAPRFQREERLFGRKITITSNISCVLDAVDMSMPLYSVGEPVDAAEFTIHFIVKKAPYDPGPPPANLFDHNRYTGFGRWLSIDIGAWGHCHIDLDKGEAIATITPQLAAYPHIISHGLLNTIFLNLLIGAGFSMLHCSGLVCEDRLLLLMAPHNTGKSTTALRLVMAGYQLLSDSQIYVSPDYEDLRLFGFPVGKAKLRQDMVPYFEQLHPHLQAEPVRDETKYSLDLRTINPAWSHDAALTPRHIDLCLLRRADQSDTTIQPISQDDVWDDVMQNSIFYDSAEPWQKNLQQAKRVVDVANCYQLTIGTDPDKIVAALANLSASHSK